MLLRFRTGCSDLPTAH